MITFRSAEFRDLDRILELLYDDVLGKERESISFQNKAKYKEAFNEIIDDKNNDVIVACFVGKIVGCMQITFIPNLTYCGGRRALIEGVRVAENMRGLGVGSKMISYAKKLSEEKNCVMIQLTTNKERPDALHFYIKNGFENTHEGLKLFIK